MSKVCGFVGSSGGENISNSGALNNSTSFNSGGVRESLEKSLNNLLGGWLSFPVVLQDNSTKSSGGDEVELTKFNVYVD